MRKVTKHKTVLNRIVKDERLSPHRRLLAEMLALWLDSPDKDEKERLLKLIEANYGSPKRTLWGEDPNRSAIGKIEEEATDALKEYFSQVKEASQEAADAVLEQNILSVDEQ